MTVLTRCTHCQHEERRRLPRRGSGPDLRPAICAVCHDGIMSVVDSSRRTSRLMVARKRRRPAA